MTKYCDECGEELDSDWELGTCENCMNNLASSITNTEELMEDII